MPEQRIAQQIAQIEGDIGELTQLTAQLTEDHCRQLARLRRVAVFTTVGLALVLLLTVVGSYLLYLTAVNSDRIDHIQQNTSTEVLCPLYDLFLDTYNPQSPRAVEDPASYEESFVVIEQGAVALGCTHTTRGAD